MAIASLFLIGIVGIFLSKHRTVDAVSSAPPTVDEAVKPTPPETRVLPSYWADSAPLRKRSLPTGTRLMRDLARRGHGELKLDNYSGTDAVATVVVPSTGKAVRSVFIKQGEDYKLTQLQHGEYLVRFAMGQDWDRAKKDFTRYPQYFEFGQVLYFNETSDKDGVEYSSKEITLNTDFRGQVPRKEISREVFRAGLSSVDYREELP